MTTKYKNAFSFSKGTAESKIITSQLLNTEKDLKLARFTFTNDALRTSSIGDFFK
jgi:hypothetical protein